VYFEHATFEHATNDLYLETPEYVDRYSAAFERLSAAALSSDESIQLLTDLIGEL
jgi:hypothetical protein